MIARALGGVAIGLALLAGVQTFNLSRSDRDLRIATTELARVRGLLGTSEAARQNEREQCAQDLAGEIERAKIEVEAVIKASQARASLTGCRPAITSQDRLKALRANSGETK